MVCGDHRRCALFLAGAFLLSLVLFALWPQADISVSGLFYDPVAGFWLATYPSLETVRMVVWHLSTAMVLLSVVAMVVPLLGRPLPLVKTRQAAFIFLLYLLGPLILVNGILKAHWGRARPADILEFGGTRMFTPPYLPADQCASNCSFVSGEGSAAVALALSLYILAPGVRRALPGWAFKIYVVLAVVVPVLGIVLRVATGRHFLSDTVFAALLVAAIALLLDRLLPAKMVV